MASEKDHTEQSALINLDSLEVSRRRKPGQAAFEESGLIDLSGFTGGGPAETRATAGVPSGGPVAASFVVAPKKSNTAVIVAIAAVVVLLLVGGAVYFGMMLARQAGQPVQPAQPVAQAPATPAAPGAAAAPVAPAPAPAAAPAATDAATAAAAADAGAPADEPPAVAENRPAARAGRQARRGSAAPSRPSPSPSPSAEDSPPPAAAAPARRPDPPAKPKPAATSEVDDMLSALDGKPAGGGGGAKPAGAGAAAAAPADPMLPDRLDRRQILTVVKQNAGAVAKCKSQPPGSSGTVMVKMQISGNGSVSEADASGPLKGTAQGNCIERTVKVFRFPQFSGPAMQINMPFSL